MKVLVDTTIWSLALRRKSPDSKEQILIDELSELVTELRAVLIGPIRQEILSGISDPSKFEIVRQHLEPFDDLPILKTDYEEAARIFNVCRKKGIQGSHVDFLICAVAIKNSVAVFTTDKDFNNYAKHLNLELHEPRKG
jgi:predicted nucleic acid-binding protein